MPSYHFHNLQFYGAIEFFQLEKSLKQITFKTPVGTFRATRATFNDVVQQIRQMLNRYAKDIGDSSGYWRMLPAITFKIHGSQVTVNIPDALFEQAALLSQGEADFSPFEEPEDIL